MVAPTLQTVALVAGAAAGVRLDLALPKGDRSDRRQRLKRETEVFSFLFLCPTTVTTVTPLPRVTICDFGPRTERMDLALPKGDRSDHRQRLKRENEVFSFLLVVPDDGHYGHPTSPPRLIIAALELLGRKGQACQENVFF